MLENFKIIYVIWNYILEVSSYISSIQTCNNSYCRYSFAMWYQGKDLHSIRFIKTPKEIHASISLSSTEKLFLRKELWYYFSDMPSFHSVLLHYFVFIVTITTDYHISCQN